ncbi:MFS multidrug transporter, putative [Tolypocladium paradoxum]|uniref:MFS multidrug transporter, putative n=1 Tax=Tolypocladium paradoxum TaxID=94208 RepID=A0A2S4KWI0_9HYPO|nr:MFS multidrug transporter, putative [Tolypocladium paradoxum]
MFIIGRAVAGLGSSGLQKGAFTIIAAAAPLEKRPALMGMVMGGYQNWSGGWAFGWRRSDAVHDVVVVRLGFLSELSVFLARLDDNLADLAPAQHVGYYLPFALFSAVVLAVGYGLTTTFSPYTETAKWAIFVGFGRGMGMQIVLIAIQANTAPAFPAMATATLVFCQTFGGAVFLAIANSIFNNVLKHELERLVPGSDAQGL